MGEVMSNIFVVDRPDYLTNKNAATVMCRRIESWYHDRGMTDVKAWLEPRQIPNSDGETINYHYDIRSNLSFKVPTVLTEENSTS